jgi:hypothetical protein
LTRNTLQEAESAFEALHTATCIENRLYRDRDHTHLMVIVLAYGLLIQDDFDLWQARQWIDLDNYEAISFAA